VDESLERYRNAAPEEWRLITQIGTKELLEIKLNDIPKMIDSYFFLCLRFWRRYKRFGIPGNDWRNLTANQLRVLETFDKLADQAKVE
jgi:hypothetical protein